MAKDRPINNCRIVAFRSAKEASFRGAKDDFHRFAAPKRMIFTELTPLGYRVVLTRDRWREIVRYKHPALAGHERAVAECLRDPDVIRASAKDANVHLYYRSVGTRFVCVVVGGTDASRRFVVTAFFTAKIKKGQELWTK